MGYAKEKTDGSMYDAVGGYRIYCRRQKEKYFKALVDLPLKRYPQLCKEGDRDKGRTYDTAECSYTVNNIVNGNYNFAVSVYDSMDIESPLSNEVPLIIK